MLETIRHIASYRATVFLLIFLLVSFTFFSAPVQVDAAIIVVLVVVAVVDAVSCQVNIIWGCGGDGGGGGGDGGDAPEPPPELPVFNTDPDPSIIIAGESITLTWSCVDSTSSSGVNFSTGDAVSGSVVVSPADTTDYTVICSNGGEKVITVTVINPELSITATPSLLQSGDTSEIAWTATNVNSCSISEDSSVITDSWSGASGTQTSSPIVEETIYTITCQTDASDVSENVTVRLVPIFQEF
ncbi:hypothetical protein ACFL6I_18130 [candidate division KSB1 bacterium]